jgi:hypothetical protein
MVGQPPFGAAVGHLPPLASAVGAKPACHVPDQPTIIPAVVVRVLRSLPPPTAAVGPYRRFRRWQVRNQHGKRRFEAICANVNQTIYFRKIKKINIKSSIVGVHGPIVATSEPNFFIYIYFGLIFEK